MFLVVGVELVGGDMFVSVPKGDAIFMKVSLNQLKNQTLFYLPRCVACYLVGVNHLRNNGAN